MDILTKIDERVCENALYAFIGIVAIQVKYYISNYKLVLIILYLLVKHTR